MYKTIKFNKTSARGVYLFIENREIHALYEPYLLIGSINLSRNKYQHMCRQNTIFKSIDY